MEEEPWNKVNIPYPCATSSSQVTFTPATANVISCLLNNCDSVLTILCSEVLQTEIRVLYELLYVLNNSSRQQKPFQAIKQVEQCINRLKDMRLIAALHDLKELCPSETQRTVGVKTGRCTVPSQPMLEWLCLKLLGASSLLNQTLDRCTRAFILTRQHLKWAEFIVLNLVLASMLSRFWVFFRGILRGLVPLYRRTRELLQEVSCSQPMAYLTSFTLPGDVLALLGPSAAELLQEDADQDQWALRVKGATAPTVLDRLFGEDGEKEGGGGSEGEVGGGREKHLRGKQRDLKKCLDLGRVVAQRLPDYLDSTSGFDLKELLKRPQNKKQIEISAKKRSRASDRAVEKQRSTLLRELKTISSFSGMAAHLRDVIRWCRNRKLHRERRRLAYLQFRCLRIESQEAEGLSVQKKLKRFQMKVHRALDGSFRPSMTQCRIRKDRFGIARMNSTTVRTLFSKARRLSSSSGMDRRRSSWRNDSPQNKDAREESMGDTEDVSMVTETAVQNSSAIGDVDIDDIFSSIGF